MKPGRVCRTAGGAFANTVTDTNLKLAKGIIRDVAGVGEPFILGHGASDSRYFAEQKVPFVLTRPVGGDAHGDGEWLEERGLGQLYEIVRRIADTVARPA